MPKRHDVSRTGTSIHQAPAGAVGAGRLLAAAACSCIVVWCIAGVAAAEPVVLVSPQQEDPMLIDAFHRLEAELRIHHFDTLLVTTDLEAAGAPSLSRVAEQHHALAAIALSRRAGQTTLDLWLVDRTSGESQLRTLEAGQGTDAASLIAVRAVDLLRASLGEFDPDRPATPADEQPSEPEPAPQLTAPSDVALWLYVEGCMLRPGADFGSSFGPALALMYRATPWFHVGLSLAVPLSAMTIDTSSGSASVHQQLASAELRLPILRAGAFAAGPLVALGAYFLQASGRATPPLMSVDDSVWSLLLSLGAQAEFRLLPRIALSLSVRAVFLAPRLGVQVDKDSVTIEQPALEAALGVAVGL
jgi:hypothetical protein